MTQKVTVVVEAADRLDKAVAAGVPNVSRRQARALIAAGAVFVEGHRCRVASRSVPPGARLVVHLAPTDDGKARRPEIVWRGGDLLAVAKPPGLHVNETETSSRASVVSAFDGRVHPVHRLDRDTSGLLLLARTPTAAAAAASLFEQRAVKKTYWAITQGIPKLDTVEAPIGADRRRPRARSVRPDGKTACTELRRLGQVAGLGAVEALPLTGRTHQVRVHLAHASSPIVGDLLYGGPAASRWQGRVVRWPRVMLHAAGLAFQWEGEEVQLISDVPGDFVPFVGLGLPSPQSGRRLEP